MSRKYLKARDKVTQRMTRDGVVLENQATGEEINISDREAEQDFSAPEMGGTAEKVLERADRGAGAPGRKKGGETGRSGSGAGQRDFPPVLPPAILRGRTGDAGVEEVHPKIRPACRPAGRGEGRYPQGNREDQGKGL